MRRTFIHRLGTVPFRHWLADRAEPAVGYCTCLRPDIGPVGGWWPASFTCCLTCSKPLL